jgi:L-rhamnose isomerase
MNVDNALNKAGLKCGAICLRFPKSMQAGAFTHPDAAIRSQAIQLTKEACQWAQALNANEVVVWSAFDGYDYSLQVNLMIIFIFNFTYPILLLKSYYLTIYIYLKGRLF